MLKILKNCTTLKIWKNSEKTCDNTKKSLAQEVRQKSDPSTLTLFATRPPVSLCDLSGSFYTKNEYSLFYQKFDDEYFFYSTIFSKKAVFSEKIAKNCFGGAFDNFFGKKASYAKN